MKIVYLDGKYLKMNDQLLGFLTPGHFKAYGVFETMLGIGRIVLDAPAHLKRMRQGLKILEIKCPTLNPQILNQLLQRNHLALARIRLMAWQEGRQTHVMAAALAYQQPPSQEFRVCLIKTDRAPNVKLSEVKSLDYEMFTEAYTKARTHGFDEALLLNRQGHIFEASRANIFWIKDNILYTPPLSSGCLNGITRRQVMRHAQKQKMPVQEKNLTPSLLAQADHAFLTNSLMGIKEIKIAKKAHELLY